MKTTPEIPPSQQEIDEINAYNAGKPNKIVQFLSYILAISIVPFCVYLLLIKFIDPSIVNILLLPLFFGWVFLLAHIFLKKMKMLE